MRKVDSDEKIAALMESIRGSIGSEATRPQKVYRNDPEHASDTQSGRAKRAGTGCSAREQRAAHVVVAMGMLVLLAPLSWSQSSPAAACARAYRRIPPGPSRVL